MVSICPFHTQNFLLFWGARDIMNIFTLGADIKMSQAVSVSLKVMGLAEQRHVTVFLPNELNDVTSFWKPLTSNLTL